jgi:hypothetical protein
VDQKEAFHKKWKKILRQIATKDLGLVKGAFDVRSCKGGPAITGEVILHTDTVYVQVCEGFSGEGLQCMYRSCVGRASHRHGPNRWMPATMLVEQREAALALIRAAMDMSGKETGP